MLKSNRSEYSRYYGDFRGVDFSSDHTLVNDSRFPYLVNMYKDYAAGGGQGIETIPGFRRRFVAPNGGRVHGIHSYRDKSGKRRVYVHAGKSLYRWDAYPSDAGVTGDVSATVTEYDEYSASADESVRIDTDYIKVEVASTTSAEFIDVRAIRKVGTQKWISIYTEAVYYGEATDALRIPGAYTFTQRTDGEGNATGVLLKVAKVIKDASGTVVASFEAGDTVEVQTGTATFEYETKIVGVPLNVSSGFTNDETYPYYDGLAFSIQKNEFDQKKSLRILKIGVDDFEDLRVDRYYTAYPDSSLSAQAQQFVSEATVLRKIDSKHWGALSPFDYYVGDGQTLFVLRGISKTEAAARHYVFAESGELEFSFTGRETYYAYVYDCPTFTGAYTALEYDEYIEDDMGDYLEIKGVDPSYAIVEMRRASSGELITEGDGAGQYKRASGTILLRKGGNVITGESVALKVRIDDPTVIYDDMNERDSTSFVFGERLYVIDGKNYLYIDDTGVHRVADNAYVPTTYINIVVGGENADAGAELEPRNMLSPYFKNTFIPDGETTEYYMNERDLEGIREVVVNGIQLTEGKDYTVDLAKGSVTFIEPPDSFTADVQESEKVDGTDGLEYELSPTKGYYICTGAGDAKGEITIANFVTKDGKDIPVREIGERAFGNNNGITKVTIPEGVIKIAGNSFYNAYNLTEIALPESLSQIGSEAFAYSGLTSVTIPKKVRSVDWFAFWHAENLKTVTFEGAPTSLSGEAFEGCKSLERITVAWQKDAVKGAPWGAPETTEITYGQHVIKPFESNTEATVVITAEKGIYPAIEGDGEATGAEFRSMIESATICTVFDNRVFFSGIPSKPNFIFWSSLKNPSYIGLLNYQQDGVGTTPITAMVPVAKTLLVLKGDTEDGGAAFYHTPLESGIDVMAKSYPSEEGLAGIGCLGAACNFLDDPVYISRLGLEAIGYLSLQNERSREHRSSLVDAKLVNAKNLASARMCEWAGYLVVLVDGKIFLADSRQKYADAMGAAQYEWYYLEDIGVFEGQYKRYEYLDEIPEILKGKNVTVSYAGQNYPVELISDVLPDGHETEVAEKIEKVIAQVTVDGMTFEIVAAMYPDGGSYRACLCNTADEMIGGAFCPAVEIKTIDDNIFFGTTNGVVCSFNFDKRGTDGAIPADYYTFDGRTIYSGCALKMDNCGIPHMTKTTVKKSTVVKAKSFMRTAAKVRVRTNKNPFNEIARINGTRFSFEDMDFSDFSFVVGEDTLFAIREKEKKWVEKQYFVYSDEFKKPFALYYLAYKYYVAGKYKG